MKSHFSIVGRTGLFGLLAGGLLAGACDVDVILGRLEAGGGQGGAGGGQGGAGGVAGATGAVAGISYWKREIERGG